MVLTNIPAPVPSTVLLFAVVGFVVVAQHTPRAVTGAPPSEATIPPLFAPVVAIAETVAVVVTTGAPIVTVSIAFADVAAPAALLATTLYRAPWSPITKTGVVYDDVVAPPIATPFFRH
jgi:hypothetical protein